MRHKANILNIKTYQVTIVCLLMSIFVSSLALGQSNMQIGQKFNTVGTLGSGVPTNQKLDSIKAFTSSLQKVQDNRKIFFINPNSTVRSTSVQGPKVGGGGNSCALAITKHTNIILDNLDLLKNFLNSDSQIERVIEKIQLAEFYLKDELKIGEEIKDAINYPSENIILISSQFCEKELMQLNPRTTGLLLHEYLGLAGLKDQEYQMTSDYILQLTKIQNLGQRKAAVLDYFIQLANNPKTDIGKSILRTQQDLASGLNTSNPSIKFPLSKNDLQIVTLSSSIYSGKFREDPGYEAYSYMIYLQVKEISYGGRITDTSSLISECSLSTKAYLAKKINIHCKVKN